MSTISQSASYLSRPASAQDAVAVTACVNAAYQHYIERMEILPGPMTEDFGAVIRECRVTVAERGRTFAGVCARPQSSTAVSR